MEHEFLEPNQDIPLKMEILERWVDKNRSLKPFVGVTALFIQHQLGNQIPQTSAMIELGLNPEKLFWLDVPYTSNAKVREALIRLGIPRRNFFVTNDYWVLDAYTPYQRRRVQTIIKDFLSDPPDRLLVLDDGAYFIEAASCFKERLPNVSVVEQTTRGFIKMESSPSMRLYGESIPVIDVARSNPKSTLEPPFIGRAVCAALLKKLEDQFSHIPRRRCLVLGFGAIGSHVAKFATDYLKFKRNHVYIFDPDENRCKEAESLGYSLWDKKKFNIKFQLVIGCSGNASFKINDFVYLENEAILASASSGSVELSREDFIELADSSKIDDIKILRNKFDIENIHSDIILQLVDREVTFLNGGFPINFNGRVNCIPTVYMQPTATMMVAASQQAVFCTTKGTVKLDPEFCSWIDIEFKAELGAERCKMLSLS
jgi:hypothetical protein